MQQIPSYGVLSDPNAAIGMKMMEYESIHEE